MKAMTGAEGITAGVETTTGAETGAEAMKDGIRNESDFRRKGVAIR